MINSKVEWKTMAIVSVLLFCKTKHVLGIDKFLRLYLKCVCISASNKKWFQLIRIICILNL